MSNNTSDGFTPVANKETKMGAGAGKLDDLNRRIQSLEEERERSKNAIDDLTNEIRRLRTEARQRETETKREIHLKEELIIRLTEQLEIKTTEVEQLRAARTSNDAQTPVTQRDENVEDVKYVSSDETDRNNGAQNHKSTSRNDAQTPVTHRDVNVEDVEPNTAINNVDKNQGTSTSSSKPKVWQY